MSDRTDGLFPDFEFDETSPLCRPQKCLLPRIKNRGKIWSIQQVLPLGLPAWKQDGVVLDLGTPERARWIGRVIRREVDSLEGMQYGTIMADPPWPYNSPRAVVGNGGRGGQDGRAKNIVQVDVLDHYNVMSVDDIIKLGVEKIAADNSHLYLWTTNSFMVEAHEVARAWGFVPKTIITWVKTHKTDPCKASMKTGYWFRSATEHVLFAVRGKLRLTGPAVSTAFFHHRLPHSVKPDKFYDLVENHSPGPYVELFARRYRLGWDLWGNEVISTASLPGVLASDDGGEDEDTPPDDKE